ncbi:MULTISPECIES: ribonuclease III [Helicobacter]|uniref:Ribonuclease 3 n=1 Tax=Helicobacter ibis TaxID=2962633 RepID=A0ABT4VDK3_9HELI|nr:MULTISPECIES: ribonuclease III [Helicobacter]MDA3966602.1 ribonuclease III [Helicobacter sp. WB40]MDA3968782.1 ribonuclease III [Helicobacter ibis]
MNLMQFQKAINYKFKNMTILKEALTHKSLKKSTHNERLEFLGDAVLDLIIGEYLFYKFPTSPEGELSKMRAAMVNEKSLSKIARYLQMGEVLYISQSEEANLGREKDSILSNAFEAVLGAIYLESNLEEVREIAIPLFEKIFPKIDLKHLFYDHKTSLQEITQALFGVIPEYKLIDSKGPDHNKEFIMAVYIDNKEYAIASGKSKKVAEQSCAKIALEMIESNSKKGDR